MSRRWRAPFLVVLTLVLASCGDEGPTEPTLPPSPGVFPARWLAWSSNRSGNWEIYAANVDLEEGVNISNNSAADITPAFSGYEGSRVAFASNRDGNYEIYVHNLETGAVSRVTNDPKPDYSPAWSGDGSRIAFVREVTPGHSQIFVMNVNGTGLANISNSPHNDIQPNWRPFADQLVFASDRNAKYGPNQYMEVYRMNSDGSGVTRLTFNDEGVDYYPSWSPDGVLIAFTTDRADVGHCYNFALEVFVMESDGSGQRNVSKNCRGDAGPTWVEDDELVIMSDRDTQTLYAWDLYRLLIDGAGVGLRLTTTGAEAGPSYKR